MNLTEFNKFRDWLYSRQWWWYSHELTCRHSYCCPLGVHQEECKADAMLWHPVDGL
jgi:hypothetical protein